jgi:hypothetical protein
VNRDVAAAIDRDLDDRRTDLGRCRELRQVTNQDVGEAMQLGHLLWIDSQRRSEDRLELVAVNLLRLRQELEDPTAVVV